jgi:hypothetical protein
MTVYGQRGEGAKQHQNGVSLYAGYMYFFFSVVDSRRRRRLPRGTTE